MIQNTHINMNNEWKYAREFREEMLRESYDDSGMEQVRIPHANILTPYHYFDESIYQFTGCYRKEIYAGKEWDGKHVLLTFEGIAHVAKVYLNGILAASHYGGYTAFTVDIAPYLEYEAVNILAVEVDSRESNNLPPFGKVIDYMTYGGIYREVYMDIKEELYIEDVFIETAIAAIDPAAGRPNEWLLHFDITLNHEPSDDHTIRYTVTDCSHNPETVLCGERELKGRINGFSQTAAARSWDLEEPALYQLTIELYEGDSILDTRTTRFGFRTCEFREDGFYLNRRKIKIIGLNRHQSYPYVGYAMPKRMQRRDAELLKSELYVNAVRTSHYPQSKHFIARCDELGLLVFTELPGWQHIGDEEWKRIACDNVREMVLQYRNHPSVILWGVRINESQDDDDFYRRTNEIAHNLDKTRQTGGVRFIKKSNLLEDVYTYNDFLHNGNNKGLDLKREVTSVRNAPYLVTEFNGHMFPSKAYDDEEHRLQHALRHSRVLEALFEQEEVAGGFGWCMCDYNTHRDFGSGDRICYHGVMDMFRNPKLAAAVYSSQNDTCPVCEVSSSMDIGEHPAGYIGEIYAFTNADSIRLYKNEVMIKEFYPCRKKYPHLPHPPVLIDDLVGNLIEEKENMDRKSAEMIKEVLFAVSRFGQNGLPLKYKLKMAAVMLKEKLDFSEGVRLYSQYIGNWGGTVVSYRFEAVKDNKAVKTVEKRPVTEARLEVMADSLELAEEETYDVSGIRITAVDGNGNRLPYYQEAVLLEADGAIEILGPAIVSLKGGAAGAYVRTKGIKGSGRLKLLQEQLGELILDFEVK